MTAFSTSFKKGIEERIKNGTLKVAGQSASPHAVKKSCEAMRKLQALGRMKIGKMNKTEAAYAQHLEALKACCEIVWWKFEAIKLRLADNTFYSPDFFIMKADGELVAHEVKGFMMDDANVKIKVAGEIFPFKFYIVRAKLKKNGGGFSVIEV
jgi:hypothetical protein